MAKPRVNQVTAEKLRELLDYDADTGLFTWRSTAKVAGYVNSGNGYCYIEILGLAYLAHRLAWCHIHGEWPTQELDHINRIQSDNRIENLRLATRSENLQNRSLSKNNTSGVTGVRWQKVDKKWIAEIKLNKKRHYLGSFLDIKDAIAARKSAELKMHPFAATRS